MSSGDLILTGNQAIAHAARDADVALGMGYPGTPSTETLETLGSLAGDTAQWAPNEKVAFEVALGVAYSGRRALVTMKHVGLNVAADPLFTASYTGVYGGLVIMVADDPGMHSSQNEQDSRHYARAAKLPMLEPSDSQEAYDFTRLAFALSEQFDTPVLLRSTTRLSHSKGIVRPRPADTDVPQPVPPADAAKHVMLPVNARKRHVIVEQRMKALAEWVETSDLTRPEYRGGDVGVVTSGVAYQYVREVAPDVSTLKLGMVWPLPTGAFKEFAKKVTTCYAVEELDPFLEDNLRIAGVDVTGKDRFPLLGELSPALVAAGLGFDQTPEAAECAVGGLPPRPPIMCAGCPHRPVFSVLKKLKLTVTGDIGCYTLGATPPLSSMDTCVCMGAAIGLARGVEKAGVDPRRVVGAIGDSTFLHSGLTGLLDMVYNRSRATILILDNGTTAMTGRQEHPGTGKSLIGEPAPQASLAGIAHALGVEDVSVIDPYDIVAFEAQVRESVAFDGPSVIIARRACILIPQERGPKTVLNEELCTACGLCLGLGCPAISKIEIERKGKMRSIPQIDTLMCAGCGVCRAVCKFDALKDEEEQDA